MVHMEMHLWPLRPLGLPVAGVRVFARAEQQLAVLGPALQRTQGLSKLLALRGAGGFAAPAQCERAAAAISSSF